jgi:glycosyltransferase involved in cell wall biosynthesis
MPTISVVVPLYNHAAYIETALYSVLRQTSPANEILVLDDGSSDDGLTKAERILANDVRAHVESQTNVGAHVTINRLFDRARSDYVAVLNSDDFFEPTKLERCRLLATSLPAPDLIVGEARIIDEANRLHEDGVAADWMQRALAARDTLNLPQLSVLYENWVATTSNMVISRSFWRVAGGFRNLRYCHDLDFLMTSFAKGCVAIDHGAAHIRYRVHSRNTIAEDIARIRLEIAAVWANALFECGPSLFGGLRPEAPEAFFSAIEPKGMTALIAMLQCARVAAPSAAAFYDDVLRGSAADALRDHLR